MKSFLLNSVKKFALHSVLKVTPLNTIVDNLKYNFLASFIKNMSGKEILVSNETELLTLRIIGSVYPCRVNSSMTKESYLHYIADEI